MTRLLLLLALAACGPRVVRETVTDGSACRSGDEVVFTFETCLSSSCSTVVSKSCTATLDGTVITVTATAEIDEEQGMCTADCGAVDVRCALPDTTGLEGVTVVIGGETIAWDDFACGA